MLKKLKKYLRTMFLVYCMYMHAVHGSVNSSLKHLHAQHADAFFKRVEDQAVSIGSIIIISIYVTQYTIVMYLLCDGTQY